MATEIIAFANTIGGTLVVGIDEETATKRAKPPLRPFRGARMRPPDCIRPSAIASTP
ncbi:MULTISPECIES: RNA-binding domain-containing protein [Bradyrhizobium]|uniref:RNA-binding domain-containing protein n=1 Tax=Bradyrhizobium TaxID=374 RepID=UPI0034E54136